MIEPQPERPDPSIRRRESWSQVLYPIVMALAFGIITFALAVRL